MLCHGEMTSPADLYFMRKDSVLASPMVSEDIEDECKAAAANVRADEGRRGEVDHA